MRVGASLQLSRAHTATRNVARARRRALALRGWIEATAEILIALLDELDALAEDLEPDTDGEDGEDWKPWLAAPAARRQARQRPVPGRTGLPLGRMLLVRTTSVVLARRVLLVCATPVVLASDVRVERREDAVRIGSVNPDVPVVMRLEHVGLVHRRGRVILHSVVRHALE